MDCNFDHMKTLGILGQVMHLSNCHAKQMFGKYDLKPGHAGILFVLNKEGELSQRACEKDEPDASDDHFGNPEDGKTGICPA